MKTVEKLKYLDSEIEVLAHEKDGIIQFYSFIITRGTHVENDAGFYSKVGARYTAKRLVDFWHGKAGVH